MKIALPVVALLLAASGAAQAASSFDLAAQKGGGNAAEYAWDGKVLTVKDGADITITGAVTNGTRIEVAGSATAAVTLDGVSISGLPTGSQFLRIVDYFARTETLSDIGLGTNQSPLTLNSGANVRLDLTGTNTLTAGDCAENKTSHYCAGITVLNGATLNIDGTGALTATGGWGGMGIGASGSIISGAIIISNGTVTANAGQFGFSGIGGNSITISGGTVTANGSENGGEGIGGDRSSAITISGGTVVARGHQVRGSGIGGPVGGKDLTITISGGTVTAYGGGEGAGIGGTIFGGMGSARTINIAITGNANVTAIGGDGNTWDDHSGGGAGIGACGSFSTNEVGTIKIDTTGTVKAMGGKGFQGGGPAANIGQGGMKVMAASLGAAGIRSFSGPKPTSASTAVGGTVSFACDVTPMADAPAPTFTWSWQFYDTTATPPQWTDVQNAASVTLTLPRVTANMAGQYRCVVKASNFPRRSSRVNPQGIESGQDSSILYASHPATLTVTAEK
jgi:hypothetical protein